MTPQATSTSSPAPADGHAARREDFRNRLLDAVEELVREGGSVGFSTRALAERAGVSPTTTFNHFGSKRGALSAVIGRSLDRVRGHFEDAPEFDHPIEQILAGCDQVTRLYTDDPALFRPVLAELIGTGSTDALIAQANQMWLDSLTRARAEHRIDATVELRLIASQMEIAWGGVIAAWTSGSLDAGSCVARAHHAIALILTAIASDSEREAMRRRLHAAALRVLSSEPNPSG